eukprot:XP_002260065.1 hypothetical protein, conserved in Plasmodium species [Plasmodium knowlesi strain H]
MSSGDVNKLISQDIQCEDTYKEDKIKIANRLVKNFSLLKELNLLSTIKNEHKGRKLTNDYKQEITYDSENIIYANKYILNFLQLKEQKRKKAKEEEKRKTKFNTKFSSPNFLSENDITHINEILYKNNLSLSTYTENIMTYDKHNNFNIFNNQVLVKHVHVPPYDLVNHSAHSEKKTLQMLTSLIESYNDTLSLIQLQQSVINDLFFYTHNLLKNKQRLTRKNERFVKAHSVNVCAKGEPQKGASTDLRPLLCSSGESGYTQPVHSSNQGNLPFMYKTQIDLYRRHINHLYHENDHLKEHLNKYQVKPNTNN